MRYILAVLFITLFNLQTATACPLGPREQTLTLARVMRNLGRFTMVADDIALRAVNLKEEIPDARISKAISDLSLAISCSDAVILHPEGDLLPSRAKQLTGADRERYIKDYLEMFHLFRDSLVEYKNSNETQLQLPKERRDFQEAYALSQKVANLASEAHKRLGGGTP